MFLLGYKLRRHIAQALSCHCAAIRNTIARYNDLAPHQKLPCPILVYSEVVDYCTFSEFEILKQSDHDVLSKDWANLTNWQAANKYFKIKCAEEEIYCCNVEVAHVQAWVDKDDQVMSRAIAASEGSNPAFAAHLKVLQIQCRHMNDHLRTRLGQIYKLSGYSGPLPPVASSSAPPAPSTIPSTALNTGVEDHVNHVHVDNEDELYDDKDELHNNKDEDEILQMMDTLVKIMV